MTHLTPTCGGGRRIDLCALWRESAASTVRFVDPETRAYLDEMRQEMNEMRREINRRFDHVDRRFDDVDQRFVTVDQRFVGLDQRFAAVDQGFVGVDQRFVGIDQRFVQLEGELRRHFGVLVESVRHEIQIVAEMVAANTEAITALRVRLDAR